MSVGTLVEKHRLLRLKSLDLPTSHSKMTLFVDLMCENLLKKKCSLKKSGHLSFFLHNYLLYFAGKGKFLSS